VTIGDHNTRITFYNASCLGKPGSDIGPTQQLRSSLYSPSAADWLSWNSHLFR
jgi:hypothetical protein